MRVFFSAKTKNSRCCRGSKPGKVPKISFGTFGDFFWSVSPSQVMFQPLFSIFPGTVEIKCNWPSDLGKKVPVPAVWARKSPIGKFTFRGTTRAPKTLPNVPQNEDHGPLLSRAPVAGLPAPRGVADADHVRLERGLTHFGCARCYTLPLRRQGFFQVFLSRAFHVSHRPRLSTRPGGKVHPQMANPSQLFLSPFSFMATTVLRCFEADGAATTAPLRSRTLG